MYMYYYAGEILCLKKCVTALPTKAYIEIDLAEARMESERGTKVEIK